MTTLISMLQGVFLEHLKTHFSNRISPITQKLGSHAWERFERQGLPSRDNELFRYVKLRKLYAQEFLPESAYQIDSIAIERCVAACQGHVIVLVNGCFCPEYSRLQGEAKTLTVLPMQEALRSYGAFLNNQLSKSEKTERDPFAILNGTLSQSGVFIYVPPKTVLSQPLHILNLVDAGPQGVLISPRIQFFFGSHAEVTLHTTHRTLGAKRYFCNQYSDFFLEEGARMTLHQLDVEAGAHAWLLHALRASLKRGASFNTTSVTNGAETVRYDYKVLLSGEGAEVSLSGLALLRERKEAHTNVWIEHQAPHCRSQQLFKAVVDDQASTSFEGKIYVAPEAQKTDAFQLNSNLLLSEHAHAYSKPNLEIFADDVKASHGATCGQLNKEQLFYLCARGLSEKDARRVLVNCFAEEVLCKVPENFHQSVKEHCGQRECIT